MVRKRLVIVMGSKSDLAFAERIGNFLKEEGFPLRCEYTIASAHRSPELLLDKLKSYEKSGDNIVYITVAGLSDALSGIVSGYTKYPVIACPPDFEKHGWPKAFSSIMMPKGVAVLFTPKPENAALAAAKILGLTDSSLQACIERYRLKNKERVIKSDRKVKASG